MQILVDSSVWIDYFRGAETPQADFLDGLIGRSPLVVSDVTLAEVLQGIPDELHRKQAEAALLKFWLVEIGGVPLHRKSALRYQTLRARGVPVRTAECLIATFCIENGFSLLHSSPGFEPFERHFGLQVAHPPAL